MRVPGPEIKKFPEDVRPEMLMLLACARTAMDAATADQIRMLARKNLDWAYLLQQANWHGTLPLLYWGLNEVCREAIPEDFLAEVQEEFQGHVRRNLFFTRELVRLTGLLEDRGISVLPFKGPVLAALVYGNVSLREFCDLDILLPEKDVLKARDLLISQGYRIRGEFADDEKAARFLSKKKDYRFVHEVSGVVVEVHWRITGKHFFFPFDLESLWGRLESVNLGGKEVLSLPSEDLLLILCVHGAKHCFGRLEWVCDIAELIRSRQGLNWPRILERARALGSERMLLLGLFLANDLLQAPLPEEVRQRIESDTKVEMLAGQTRKSLFTGPTGPLSVYEGNGYRLKIRERWRDKLRLGLHYLSRYLHISVSPNGRDLALFPLPKMLSFLYYVLRPVRLTTKFSWSLFKGLRRRFTSPENLS